MSTLKKCKVVMLPTNEVNGDFSKERTYPAILKHSYVQEVNSKLCYTNCNIRTPTIQQHLYFLSDDEIKESDWCLRVTKSFNDSRDNLIPKLMQNIKGPIGNIIGSKEYINTNWKKIIATTDESLVIKKDCPIRHDSVSFINYILPQPSQSFIEKYVEEYNKSNQIKEVLVEYEQAYIKGNYSNICCVCKEQFYNTDKLGFICPKHYYLKVNPKDNTITTKKVKDSWDREEVIRLMQLCYDKGTTDFEKNKSYNYHKREEYIKNII